MYLFIYLSMYVYIYILEIGKRPGKHLKQNRQTNSLTRGPRNERSDTQLDKHTKLIQGD